MYQTARTCRTCRRQHETLIDLFEPWNLVPEANIQLAEALMECTATQVMKEDGLPQKICEDCLSKLEISYNFRNQALNADVELRKSFLIQATVKDEPKELKPEISDDFDDYPVEFDFFKDELITDHVDDLLKKELLPLECSYCEKKYSCEKRFQKHLLSHEEPKFNCLECDKKFRKQSQLDRHRAKTHLDDCKEDLGFLHDTASNSENIAIKTENDLEEKLPYKCTKCNLAYPSHRSLASHAKKHNKEAKAKKEQYECDVCRNVYSSKNLLRRHLKLHSNSRPHQCSQCSKSYSRSDQLKEHLKKHEGIKPNVCPYCNKGFSQVCNLKDHIRTHTKETPYLCSECGKGFNNSSNLRQHMLRHTGLRPFPCSLCPKMFATKGQMQTHMDTHSGAHPYKCGECGATFTKPQSLKKHALIHLGVKPHACDVCPMRFTCKDHLKRHQRIHTGEKPYQCKYCTRGFTQTNDLHKHLRTHVGQNIYQCTVCDMRFRILGDLKRHYPVHYINDAALPAYSKMPTDFIAQPEADVPPPATCNMQPATCDLQLDNKENNSDHTITIIFNPEGMDKTNRVTGSITIDMNPGKS